MEDRRTLVDVLQRTFERDPGRTALVFLEDGEVERARLTAADLDARARAIAATLQHAGRPGDRALLLYPSGPDFVCAYIACLYAGVVPVPCSMPSRQRADPRVTAVAADADVRWVLAAEPLFAARDRCISHHPLLERCEWISTSAVDLSLASAWRAPVIDAHALALLQYTSGSTSAPRGVMVTHGNLLENLHDLTVPWPYDANSVMVTWLPLFHDLGLIFGLLRPLVQGFLCVMMPPAAFLQRPSRWLQAISRYRGTHTGAPNFAYELCVSRVSEEEKRSLDLSSWYVALNGAEPIHADTLERFNRAFAPCGLPPTTMSSSYGLAEATLGVAMTPFDETSRVLHADAAEFGRGVVVPASSGSPGTRIVDCGPLAHSVTVRVVDPLTCEASAPDRVGEIWVRGAAVAKGYWRNAAATRETFEARVAGDDDGPYMRTGDLGFVRDGRLFVTGRHKDLIIVHGLNYYPQDIELTVERSHPSLAHTGAAAFAVEVSGEERVVVFAEVQRTQLKRLDTGDVFAAVAGAVSQEHGLALHAVALLGPRTLPKTSSGKVRRAHCRELFVSGALEALAIWRAPGGEAADGVRTDTPSTARELREWLIERFAHRLNIPRAAIDPRASFAMVGLASVDAVGLSGEMAQWLGRPLSPTLFYDYPSIDALAAHLSGDSPGAGAAVGARARTAPDAGIAVVGLGCRFPGAADPEALWQLLERGGDAIRAAPADRGLGAGAAGGFLDGVDGFDAAFFGISPREAERTDPQQRLLLEVAWEAIEHAGIAPGRLAGTRAGVFIGISNSDYGRLLAKQGETDDLYFGTGSALSIAANRISYALDLRGPSLAVDTACSASLVAVALAVQSLRRDECDTAIAGGVNLILSPEYSAAFAKAQMLSRDGRCKAFSSGADGYGRGEGVGAVVLKRLADAERAGDRILAVIRGVGLNQDGRTTGLTAPNGPAQQAVVRAALRDAGVAPADVGYVEAHGTGTPLGDPIEINALAGVLMEGRSPDAVCRIGSIKTNIGHLESAAGIAALIKTVLCLSRRRIPASLHCADLNPRLEIAGTPIQIARTGEAWVAGGPRIAGVSSFGFGGTNAHVVVQEYLDARPSLAEPGPCVLTLSARDREALTTMAARYARALEGADALRFADVCFTSNVGRSDFSERLAIVAGSAEEARAALDAWRRAAPATAAAWDAGTRGAALAELASAWESGAPVDWEAAHAGQGAGGPEGPPSVPTRRRKVDLPTYPFTRSRYWLPRTMPSGITYRLEWRPVDRDRPARENGEPRSWVIFADDSGVGDAVGRELSARGDLILIVRRGDTCLLRDDGSMQVRADDPRQYARVFEQAARRLGGRKVHCLHLWSLDAPDIATPERLAEALDRGAASVVLLLQAMLAVPSGRIWMVTRLAQPVREPASDAGLLQSPVWGIGKTLALEHPEHWGGLIDIDHETPAAELADEIRRVDYATPSDDLVALRSPVRLVARVTRAASSGSAPTMRPESSYLITGGLGTLGLALARRLVEIGARRLVLASRGGQNSPGRQRAVAVLEHMGARVLTPSIDVTDVAALEQLCRQLAEQGAPLAGVIHAAGLAERAPLRSVDVAALRSMVAVKAGGALALRQATAGQSIDFWISVSSMASAWGAAGLSSYVAANAFLDVFAYARMNGATGASVSLGPVTGGMLPPELVQSMTDMGVTSWAPDQAAALLLAHASRGVPHVIAAEIDWQRFVPLLETRGRRPLFDDVRPAAPSGRPASASMRAVIAASAGADRDILLRTLVSRETGAVLGLAPAQSPDPLRGFFDLGLDSLMAVELRKRLEAIVGEDLPATLVFDHPNVNALAAFLGRTLPGASHAPQRPVPPAVTSAPPVDPEAVEAVLTRLERLL